MNEAFQQQYKSDSIPDAHIFGGTVYDSESTEDPDWQTIPTDVKKAFGNFFNHELIQDSDTDSTEKIKKNRESQESIVFDEEYEIFTHQTIMNFSDIKICPFCNKYIIKNEQFIFTSCLNQYFNVHLSCCESYQKKQIEFKLYQFPDFKLKCARITNSLNQIYPYITLEDSKVFIDLQIFHPIGLKPLIKLDYSTTIQYLKQNEVLNFISITLQQDAIIQLEFNMQTMNQQMYHPKKMYIPFIEGRIQLDLYIFGLSSNKAISIVFFYDLQGFQNSENITIKYEEEEYKISLYCLIESKNIQQLQSETQFNFDSAIFGNNSQQIIKVLHFKSLKCQINKFLKNTMCHSQIKAPSTQRKMSCTDSFIFNQLTPMQSTQDHPKRQRFESLQLNEIESISSPSQEVSTFFEMDDLHSIEEIRGQIVSYITSQHGSRTIQKLLTTTNQSEIEILISEIEPFLADLMIDPYANYIFGSLSQSCTPQQRYHILKKISPRIIEITCDKKGTHAVQALVALVNSSQEEDLIEKSIKEHIILLILDNQGTHLIKKVISRFSENKLANIFKIIMEKFVKVVNHQYGLCVLKDLMTRFKLNDEKREIILFKLNQHIDEILQDPYGNYAVQHALELFGDKKCGQIIDRILQKIVQLSIHKYSSNVVEKCILETTQSTRMRFLRAISNDHVSIELMKNKFGSFVLQKAINEADKLGYLDLIISIRKNLQQIYTANIKQKWQDYLDSFSRKQYFSYHK